MSGKSGQFEIEETNTNFVKKLEAHEIHNPAHCTCQLKITTAYSIS